MDMSILDVRLHTVPAVNAMAKVRASRTPQRAMSSGNWKTHDTGTKKHHDDRQGAIADCRLPIAIALILLGLSAPTLPTSKMDPKPQNRNDGGNLGGNIKPQVYFQDHVKTQSITLVNHKHN